MGIDFRRPRHIRGFRLGEVMVFGPGIGKTLVEKTVSGAVASFEDGADDVSINNFECTIDANISGVSSITVYNQSKNLIRLYTRSNNAGIDYSINPDGSLHREGTATSNSYNNGNASNYASCPFKLKAGTYTISISGSTTPNDYVSFGMISASGSSLTAQNIYGNTSKTFIVDEDFGAWYWCKINNGTNVNDNMYISLVKGDRAGETVPSSTNVPLGRTIYGGTADVVTGEGVDENAIIPLDSGITWDYRADNKVFRSSVLDFNSIALCSCFDVETYSHVYNNAEQYDNCISINSTYNRLYVSYQDANGDVSALQTHLIGQKLVIKKATPETFTFTPITPTPETALGVNNLWNDCGDSEVTYYADPDLSPTQLQSSTLIAAEEQNSSTQEDDT